MNTQLLVRAKPEWEYAADSMPQFICLLDRDGRVLRANRAAERWKPGIEIEDACGLRLHDVLHRGCVDPRCYLRRFGERAAVALAQGRHADCDAWDPLLRRHFLIRARRPVPKQQRRDSVNEVFAVVTVDDVSEFKASGNEPENLTRALHQRVGHEQGKRAQAEPVHSRISDGFDRTPGCSARERDMSEWVKAEDALRASQSELRQLAAQHLTAQETERRRIAAELHDGLGQSLSLLKLGIQEALRQMGAGAPPKAAESVKRLIPKVEGALDELRRVSMELRPSSLDDLGLLPTLSWFVREFEGSHPKTRIEKDVSVSEKDVPAPLRISIYRILQEAVNNAVRHADPECIRLSLHNGDGVLAFSIEDDGRGFDAGALARRGDAGMARGMQRMRQRAEFSGGTCAVTSAAGQGTKVCAWWPANQATDHNRDQARCALCGRQIGATVDAAEAVPCYCSNALGRAPLESMF